LKNPKNDQISEFFVCITWLLWLAFNVHSFKFRMSEIMAAGVILKTLLRNVTVLASPDHLAGCRGETPERDEGSEEEKGHGRGGNMLWF